MTSYQSGFETQAAHPDTQKRIMVSSNRVSFITLAILLVISFFSSLSGASPVRTSSNKFVAGKPLTQEEFNSPPRYSTRKALV